MMNSNALSNQCLFEAKKEIARTLISDLPQTSDFSESFSCLYHGVPVLFHFQNNIHKAAIEKLFPASWRLQSWPLKSLQIFCYGHNDFSFGGHQWNREASPLYHLLQLKGKNIAVQRDFIGVTHSSDQVSIVIEPGPTDSFFNAMRWLLPEKLLEHGRTILHSSCVVTKNNKAAFFLGHSGAGKTTVASLAGERIVLGDDMNVLFRENGIWKAQSGLFGGKICHEASVGTSFEVDAFYWLKQSHRNIPRSLAPSEAAMKFLASCANIFVPALPRSSHNALFSMAEAVACEKDFFELEFTINQEFWAYVER